MLIELVVGLVLLDYYFRGDRIVMANFKTAAGVFEQDKFLPLLQGAVNLIISIVLVQQIGLVGIYIGTVISGIIANVVKPFIVYPVCFDRSVGEYFKDYLLYLIPTSLILIICAILRNCILKEVTLLGLIVMGILIIVVYNVIWIISFFKTKEFQYMIGVLKEKMLGKLL